LQSFALARGTFITGALLRRVSVRGACRIRSKFCSRICCASAARAMAATVISKPCSRVLTVIEAVKSSFGRRAS
jgi:hypothetical protein